MDSMEEIKSKIKQHEDIGIIEILDKEIKKFGTSAHIYLPIKYAGRKVKVLVLK